MFLLIYICVPVFQSNVPLSKKSVNDDVLYMVGFPWLVCNMVYCRHSWVCLCLYLELTIKLFHSNDFKNKATRHKSYIKVSFVFHCFNLPFWLCMVILKMLILITDVVRSTLPTCIPPSYKGATIRYMYCVKSTLVGRWLSQENCRSHKESPMDQIEMVCVLVSKMSEQSFFDLNWINIRWTALGKKKKTLGELQLEFVFDFIFSFRRTMLFSVLLTIATFTILLTYLSCLNPCNQLSALSKYTLIEWVLLINSNKHRFLNFIFYNALLFSGNGCFFYFSTTRFIFFSFCGFYFQILCT